MKNPPVAVLLHGLTRSKEDWLSDAAPTYGGALTEHLLGSGYRVYLMDARRHGARLTPDAKPGALAAGLVRSDGAAGVQGAHALHGHLPMMRTR